MWIITKDGVAINVDHVSKMFYRHPDTMAKVDGQTTIIATGNVIQPILDAMKNNETTINFREGL